MIVLKTANSTTWSLKLDGLSLNDLDLKIHGDIDHVASFNPAYPYMYVPEVDFGIVSTQINGLFSKIVSQK